jgi:L-lactate dehydrogenase complex protein LldG
MSDTPARDAREAILGRVRAALADRPEAPDRSGPHPARAGAGGDDLVARFVERVEDYRAHVTVVRGAPEQVVGPAVAAALARHDAQKVVVPPGFPPAWAPEGVTVAPAPADPDAAPDARALAELDGVVTTCATAIAETGTIVLDAGPGQGPRALTLIPDLHVCVVPASRIVPGVVQAVTAMRHSVDATRRPLTLISGPSATSDIELDRVEGVHGPRRLEVVVVDDRPHAGPEKRPV